jgi:Na+-driven multidrug efflux pump
LAPVLIVGWGTGHGFGVAGAGLASSLAVMIGLAMLWIYLDRSGRYLVPDPSRWRPSLEQCRRILRIGLPAGGEFAMVFVFMAVIYYALSDLGAAAQAGFGIATRLLGLIQVPALAIAFAAGPIIGQNFGAGDGARVRATFRRVLLLETAIMLVATMLAEWRPQSLLGVFTTDADTIAVGATFLKLVSLNLVAQGVLFLCTATFQGLGHTAPQLLSSATRLVTYAIPILFLSSRPWFRIEYIEYIWYASIATTSLQALLSLWLLRREFRKRLAAL